MHCHQKAKHDRIFASEEQKSIKKNADFYGFSIPDSLLRIRSTFVDSKVKRLGDIPLPEKSR
jgi:hypothetical protein